MRKALLKYLSVFLAVFLCFSIFGNNTVCFAENNTSDAVGVTNSKDSFNKYIEYAQAYTEVAKPIETVKIEAETSFVAENGADVEVADGYINWNSDNGTLSWEFDVENTGMYDLRMTYKSLNDNAFNVEFGIMLDDVFPFEEAEYVSVPKCYVINQERRFEENGDEIKRKLLSHEDFVTSEIIDTDGTIGGAYGFYLEAGHHKLSLVGASAQIAIDKIEFFNQAELPSYSEYSAKAKISKANYKAVYEAETPKICSSSLLYPTYDNTDINTSPNNPVSLRYNTIGGRNFSSVGQYVVWNVTVPEDGYYYLGARVRQNISTGTNSYRKLYINGVIPFKEAQNIKFSFSNKWQDYVFGDDEPWLFYLNKGDNEIKLEVTTGEMTQIISELNSLVEDISSFYRKIIMITGVTPDGYRDYKLETAISGYNETIDSMLKSSKEILDLAKNLGNDSSGNFSTLDKLIVLLGNMKNEPQNVSANISSLSSYSSSISSLMMGLKSQPLELDTISVSSISNSLKTQKAGFFKTLAFHLKKFLGSFTKDYNMVGSAKNEGSSIDVWINLGRDQADVLKSVSDDLFTQKTGISANVSLVQQSMVQAILSGKGPDVVLFVGNTEPVNLAMRNGLVALSDFEEFNDVIKRFQKNSMQPYYYNDKYYAVPITQLYQMMFVRTDIFDELDLQIPQTWEDFLNTVRALQHNNLTAGIPNAESSNVMTVNTDIYSTLLYQSGSTLYKNDLRKVNLSSEVGIKVFDTWTSFYKDYGLPYQYDFFNRFRTGDMPMGLYNYTLYGQLKIAAPEIEGKWEMYQIPGTVTEDGTINRSVAANGTCAVILKSSDNVNGAWEYIKWFTDTEAQTKFGIEIEALLGASGRYATANVKAMQNLPWTYSEKEILLTQWNQAFNIPQVPGSYYMDRNLINAFRKVVFYSENSRETIVSYSKTIEYEIERKYNELSN